MGSSQNGRVEEVQQIEKNGNKQEINLTLYRKWWSKMANHSEYHIIIVVVLHLQTSETR